ncbi:MAG: hypothetical protein V1857_06050 [archaeon]
MEAETSKRLAQLLMKKGYRQQSSSDPDANELWFSDGRNILIVRILNQSDLRSRNAILDASLSALSLASKANLVYLAIPKLQASVLDASILQERGLGLITHDSRSVDETVVARKIEREQPRAESSADIEWMKNRITALEKTVDSLAS